MPRLILECAVRAALIALGTAGVLRLLRVKTAGARHAAWAGVLILMLLLPVWTAWGPRAAMRVLPPTAASAANLPIPFSAPVPMAATAAAVPTPSRPPSVWSWRTALAAVYLLGVFCLLMRLALGTLRAHVLVRQAEERDGRLTSSSCAAPVTVGWLRPTVILPSCWRAWPQAQLDAVLTHEGEHARRRDPLVQWLALLNRAIFWFHPLAWWLERRLSALAEEACDAVVLARGHDPYDYSEYLLEIARSIGRTGVRVNVVGMAMPGSSLPQRIRQILGRRPAPHITRVRALCLAGACVTVSAVFAAATVDRQAFVPDPPLPPAPPAVALAPVAAPAPLPPVPVSAPLAPAPQPPTPPQPPSPYQNSRLIALYFDMLGMTADDQARTIAAATRFVNSQMQSTDLVAIITSGAGAPKVVQDFTGDRYLLADLIQHMSGDSTEPVDADKQLAKLRTVTLMLGALPEKKALVYFTAGAPQTDGQAQLQAAVNAAARANVAFYPIEVRGLVTSTPFPANQQFELSAGDSVAVSVSGNPQFDGTYVVRPDGMVAIPLLGDIKAAGLTPLQLQAVINERFASKAILNDAKTTVKVIAIHSKK